MKHSDFIGKFGYGESGNIHQKMTEEVIKEIGLVEGFFVCQLRIWSKRFCRQDSRRSTLKHKIQ